MSDGRGVSVPAMVDGRPLRLASVYAHADGSRRPEFFKKELRRFLTKQTVLGIDANCVPDVQRGVGGEQKKIRANNQDRHHRGLGAHARRKRRDHSSADQPQDRIRRRQEEPRCRPK